MPDKDFEPGNPKKYNSIKLFTTESLILAQDER